MQCISTCARSLYVYCAWTVRSHVPCDEVREARRKKEEARICDISSDAIEYVADINIIEQGYPHALVKEVAYLMH